MISNVHLASVDLNSGCTLLIVGEQLLLMETQQESEE